MTVRKIIHVDMDAFFASVEQADNPELQGKPVIVGGDPKGRGVVSAASYEARKFGVHSAMPMYQAIRLCPDAVILPVRMSRYGEISGQIHEIFNQFTPLVEPLSIDEAFLDVSGCERLFGSVEIIGHKIKDEIKRQTKLTASVGIAPNKFLAKLASDMRKPDGFVIITEQNAQSILDPLDVSRLPGVGKVTGDKLKNRGINTVAQLRKVDIEFLKNIVGSFAEELLGFANGCDDRPVEIPGQVKSISSEYTFANDIADAKELLNVLDSEVEKVAKRLREDKLKARTVTVKLRYGDFQTITRSKTLSGPTDVTVELLEAGWDIFEKWRKTSAGALRLIGFGVSNLTENSSEQLLLFDDKSRGKQKNIDTAMDKIRKRFGGDSVRRG